ncbi:MAG: diguanylate cyclase [Spirochaetota bacterium]
MKQFKSNTILFFSKEQSTNLENLKAYLQEKVYQIQEKSELSSVEKAIVQNPPGVIVIDSKHPDSSACVSLVKNNDKQTPILVLSDSVDTTNIQESLALGVNDFLHNTLPLALIHQRIQTYLKLKQNQLELQELETVDSLTSLSNRRHFQELLDLEWRRCRRESHAISLLSIQIDSYQVYLEEYGEEQANGILQRIASLLSNFANRAGDLCARYEGDNFMIIYSKTPGEGAKLQAEKIRQAIKEKQFTIEEGKTITVSIGVATLLPKRNVFPRSLLELAMQNLHQAKTLGNDRVLANELSTSPQETPTSASLPKES